MRLPALALTTCLLLGCAQTKIQNTWRAPQDPPKKIQKFAVFAVTGSPSGRIAYEDTLTQRLKDAGLPALPGYDIVTYDEHPGRDEVIQRLKAKQIDGALVTRIDSRNVKTESTPVWVTTGVPGPYFYDYYSAVAVGTYTTEESEAVVETVLFSLEDGRPYWMARTFTKRTDPNKFAKDIAPTVASSLKESGLFAP